METLVMNILLFLLVLATFAGAADSYGQYKTCLSCSRVSRPDDCKTFIEIWPHERCSINLLLLINGSTVHTFGFETASDCIHSDSLALRIRERRMSLTDISLCHECCSESLCNRRLCGIHDGNNTNVACLDGNEVSGFPLITPLIYCNEGEQCYARRLHPVRPNQINYGNYGCASQVMCAHLERVASDTGPSCQRCCDHDGCNAHICQSSQVPDQRSTTEYVVEATQTGSIVASAMDIGLTDSSTVTSTMRTSPPASAVHTTQRDITYSNCWDLQTRGHFTQSGIYDIYPPPTYHYARVKCDMRTDGGGWTIIQRRHDGTLSFARTFQEYEEGFGVASEEYWLGLEWIHVLTTQGAVQVRVDLCTSTDQVGYAVYDEFRVSDRNDTYRLRAGTFREGSIGDYLRSHNAVFQATGTCASLFSGGWWYRESSCYVVRLNSNRYSSNSQLGIVWPGFGGYGSLPRIRSSEMKIRPVNATADNSRPYSCPPN